MYEYKASIDIALGPEPTMRSAKRVITHRTIGNPAFLGAPGPPVQAPTMSSCTDIHDDTRLAKLEAPGNGHAKRAPFVGLCVVVSPAAASELGGEDHDLALRVVWPHDPFGYPLPEDLGVEVEEAVQDLFAAFG